MTQTANLGASNFDIVLISTMHFVFVRISSLRTNDSWWFLVLTSC